MMLEKALRIVKERESVYGDATQTFEQVAVAFSFITGCALKPEHIPLIQILLKLVRMQHSPQNQDHTIDCCGYLELMSRIICPDMKD